MMEAFVQTNKRLLFLCTTLNNDPIRTICLNQPPFPALLSQYLRVSNCRSCWVGVENVVKLLLHAKEFSVLSLTLGICVLLLTNVPNRYSGDFPTKGTYTP